MAEGMAVMGATWVAVIACPQLNPMQSALTSLHTAVNPVNIFYSTSYRPFDDPYMPLRLRGLELYSLYLYNLNTGLIVLVVPLVLGIVFKLFSLCLSLSKK